MNKRLKDNATWRLGKMSWSETLAGREYTVSSPTPKLCIKRSSTVLAGSGGGSACMHTISQTIAIVRVTCSVISSTLMGKS